MRLTLLLLITLPLLACSSPLAPTIPAPGPGYHLVHTERGDLWVKDPVCVTPDQCRAIGEGR
jgi:hypothetical protein